MAQDVSRGYVGSCWQLPYHERAQQEAVRSTLLIGVAVPVRRRRMLWIRYRIEGRGEWETLEHEYQTHSAEHGKKLIVDEYSD